MTRGQSSTTKVAVKQSVDQPSGKQIILIVEDDQSLREGLSYELSEEGYEILETDTCTQALLRLESKLPDLTIIDVNLPDGDGYSLCQQIKKSQDVPVIFLTAKDLVEEQLQGFEAGADDYVTKPFNILLLRKRIEAVLKRAGGENAGNRYEDAYMKIDFDHYVAEIQERRVDFTPTEYKLLWILFQNRGHVVTRQMILDRLWDLEGNFVEEHALTVNINRIRNKLENEEHKYIKTVYGLGYTWGGETYE